MSHNFDFDDDFFSEPEKKELPVLNYRQGRPVEYGYPKGKKKGPVIQETIIPEPPADRVIDTYSEAWKRETFARYIAKKTFHERKDFLESYQDKHRDRERTFKMLNHDVNCVLNKGYLNQDDIDYFK
jgi:hypothetical protein